MSISRQGSQFAQRCSTHVFNLTSGFTPIGTKQTLQIAQQSHAHPGMCNAQLNEWCHFAADCKHELKPVVSGYRLALVYSLCSFSSGPAPALQDNAELFARIREAMQQWADSKDRPFKGIWMLEHR